MRRPAAPPTGRAVAGRAVYEASCARCHGTLGDGGIGPSLRARRVALAPDAAIAGVIERGLPNMPAVPLSADDERSVLAYLRYLQGVPGGS